MKPINCSICSCQLCESKERPYLYCDNKDCAVYRHLIEYSHAETRHMKKQQTGEFVYVSAVCEQYEDWQLLRAHDDEIEAVKFAKATAERLQLEDSHGSEYFFKSIMIKYRDVH